LLRFDGELLYENAGHIQADSRFAFLALPQGPEPGPQMPKKRRPKIV